MAVCLERLGVTRESAAMFTGHRMIWNPNMQRDSCIALTRMIDRAAELGKQWFISGMAIGVDMWAAEIVLRRGYKLICAIPCIEQSKVWGKPEQDRYFSILERAGNVVYVSSDGYAHDCMQRRNVWMCQNASLLIGVYDGRQGGTRNAIEAAKGMGLTGGWYNPVAKKFHVV